MEWKTAITEVKGSDVRLRGYSLQSLVGKLSYSQMVCLLLKGDLPTAEEEIVLDAIMVASSDRGLGSASAVITRQAAAAGASLHTAVTSGILSLSAESGLAADACMELLLLTMDRVSDGNGDLETTSMAVVSEILERGERVPGFGTPGQESDPVATTVLDLVEGLNLPLAGATQVARTLEVALAVQTERHIPINISGAIAVALCELNFPPVTGNALFLMGRLPGLVAHCMEEKLREVPGRNISISGHQYDGPALRELE